MSRSKRESAVDRPTTTIAENAENAENAGNAENVNEVPSTPLPSADEQFEFVSPKMKMFSRIGHPGSGLTEDDIAGG